MAGSGISRAILCTNHLNRWAGSELVAIELAEALREREIEVAILCNSFSPELAKPLHDQGIVVEDAPERIQIEGVDLIYCQHQLASLLLPRLIAFSEQGGEFPALIYNHLSPHDGFELPGPFVEEALADVVLCNSPETRDRLLALSDFYEVARVLPNPAPQAFCRPPRSERGGLRSLLVVSNHLPPEVESAVPFLNKQGVKVIQVGRKSEHRRLDAATFSDVDAVLTIGKTVQYAVAARVPVFCYDHFGGPGWLTAENFETAALKNFSGRCSGNRRSAEDIVAELMVGFPTAHTFVGRLTEEVGRRYLLETYLDSLLAELEAVRADQPRQEQRRAKLRDPEFRGRVSQEVGYYSLLRAQWRRILALESKIAKRKTAGKFWRSWGWR